ncbi:MAG: hypothetical protein ACM3KE_11455 [Hyphomicrobiales bacterium]
MKRYLNLCRVWLLAALLTLFVSLPAAMAMQEEIVGAVIDTGVGYAVIANSGEYIVLDRDLSPYVGDTVAVQGNVEVGADSLALDHIKIIRVLSKQDLIDPRGAQVHVAG